MKKLLLSTCVIALFAMGFAASGENEDEVYYDQFGHKYHKVHLKCVKCGTETWYWEADDGSGSINKPGREHFSDGDYYCGSTLNDCFPK